MHAMTIRCLDKTWINDERLLKYFPLKMRTRRCFNISSILNLILVSCFLAKLAMAVTKILDACHLDSAERSVLVH